MFAVTLASLFLFAWKNFAEHAYVLGAMATFLFVLSIVLIVLARNSLKAVDKQLARETSSGRIYNADGVRSSFVRPFISIKICGWDYIAVNDKLNRIV